MGFVRIAELCGNRTENVRISTFNLSCPLEMNLFLSMRKRIISFPDRFALFQFRFITFLYLRESGNCMENV